MSVAKAAERACAEWVIKDSTASPIADGEPYLKVAAMFRRLICKPERHWLLEIWGRKIKRIVNERQQATTPYGVPI